MRSAHIMPRCMRARSSEPSQVRVSEPCRDVRNVTAMAVSDDHKWLAVAENMAGERPPQVCMHACMRAHCMNLPRFLLDLWLHSGHHKSAGGSFPAVWCLVLLRAVSASRLESLQTASQLPIVGLSCKQLGGRTIQHSCSHLLPTIMCTLMRRRHNSKPSNKQIHESLCRC